MKLFLRTPVLSLIALLAHVPASAGAALFGLEPAQTTLEQAQQTYTLTRDEDLVGLHRYTVDRGQIAFDGLLSVSVVFDPETQVLTAIIAVLHKRRFDSLDQALGAKYKLTKEQKPFVGDQLAAFDGDGTEIVIYAPHMSFEMQLCYSTPEFLQRVAAAIEAARKTKANAEAEQL